MGSHESGNHFLKKTITENNYYRKKKGSCKSVIDQHRTVIAVLGVRHGRGAALEELSWWIVELKVNTFIRIRAVESISIAAATCDPRVLEFTLHVDDGGIGWDGVEIARHDHRSA